MYFEIPSLLPSISGQNAASARPMLIYLGQSIQEWTKSNLLKTAFKKFEGI